MEYLSSCDAVLIVGNGFDKNCGLKTSYKDVYESYLVTPSDGKIIADFKRDISSDYDNWSDFEFAMSRYASNFDSEEAFLECLDDFNGYMHEYLIGVQNQFFSEWNGLNAHTNVNNEFINSIRKLGDGVSHNISNSLLIAGIPVVSSLGFISLNYTSILDYLLDSSYGTSSHYVPIHIHGKLEDDPILGMDRETQLKLKFQMTNNFKRSFLKPVFNDEYDSKRISDAKEMIKKAKVIFVFGASLGESDLSWRELLVEWLKEDVDHQLFLYKHRNAEKSFKTVPARMNYEDVEKINTLKQWKVKDGEVLLKQLHLPCGINLFNLEPAMKRDATIASKPLVIN